MNNNALIKTFLKTNDFIIKELRDVIEYENGKGHESLVAQSGNFTLINSKFISTNGETKKYCTKQLTPAFKNDIAMVLSDLPNGKALAKCFIINEDNKYTINQRICKLSISNNKLLNSKYLYYYLDRNKQLLLYDDKTNQTNLTKDMILSVNVPIPPMEVQNEIVRILDKFTELEAELEARIKQYEYYRNKLLTFDKEE